MDGRTQPDLIGIAVTVIIYLVRLILLSFLPVFPFSFILSVVFQT